MSRFRFRKSKKWPRFSNWRPRWRYLGPVARRWMFKDKYSKIKKKITWIKKVIQTDKFHCGKKYRFYKLKFSSIYRFKRKINKIKKLTLRILKKQIKLRHTKKHVKSKYKKPNLDYFLFKKLQYKYGWLYTNSCFYIRKKSMAQMWNFFKYFLTRKKLKIHYLRTNKYRPSPFRPTWKKKRLNARFFMVAVVKRLKWIKERKKWAPHRMMRKIFRLKSSGKRSYYFRLKKSYLNKLMIKKFLLMDFWFECKKNWSYQNFVNSYYRLLIKYLINLNYVKNIFFKQGAN